MSSPTNQTPTAGKLDRKSLKRPDQFMTATSGFFQEMSKHTRGVLLGIIAIVIVGVIGGLLMNQRQAKTQAAGNALYLAQKAVEKDLVAAAPRPAAVPSPAPSAQPEASPYLKLDVDQRVADGVAQLKAVIDQYPGTRAAFEAQMTLGNLYFNHGEPAKAVAWYQKAIEAAPNPFQKALGWTSLGYSLEGSGKCQDAIVAFDKAINLGEASLKGDLMLAKARCYEALKDTAKARSTYDEIVSQLPNTEYAKSAQSFKAGL